MFELFELFIATNFLQPFRLETTELIAMKDEALVNLWGRDQDLGAVHLQSQCLFYSQGVGTELRPTLVELAPAGEVAPVLFGREVSTIWLIRSFEVCKDDDAASDAD